VEKEGVLFGYFGGRGGADWVSLDGVNSLGAIFPGRVGSGLCAGGTCSWAKATAPLPGLACKRRSVCLCVWGGVIDAGLGV